MSTKTCILSPHVGLKLEFKSAPSSLTTTTGGKGEKYHGWNRQCRLIDEMQSTGKRRHCSEGVTVRLRISLPPSLPLATRCTAPFWRYSNIPFRLRPHRKGGGGGGGSDRSGASWSGSRQHVAPFTRDDMHTRSRTFNEQSKGNSTIACSLLIYESSIEEDIHAPRPALSFYSIQCFATCQYAKMQFPPQFTRYLLYAIWWTVGAIIRIQGRRKKKREGLRFIGSSRSFVKGISFLENALRQHHTDAEKKKKGRIF